MNDHPSPPRPPRCEPEIIPPGAPHGRQAREERVVFVEMQSGRLPFYRPSLFTLLLIAGLVGVTLAILLVLLLGAFLLSLPVVGLVFLALLIASALGAQRRMRR